MRLPYPVRKRQAGTALFISLITLVVMSLAAVSLMRSVDVGGLIAGNMAFKQSSMQLADLGMEAAYNQLTGLAGSFDSNASGYYSTMQGVDSKGMPSSVSWNSSIPGVTLPNGYAVSYVIERLCAGTPPFPVPANYCLTEENFSGGSKREGSVAFSGGNTFYFRVTVRVDGPRNTTSHTQAVFAF